MLYLNLLTSEELHEIYMLTTVDTALDRLLPQAILLDA